MKTIATQIEDVEKEIITWESRLDAIDRLCRLTNMTKEKWQSLQQEKTLLEQQVIDNRKKLSGLRWENWRTMLISAILLAVVYLVFSFFYAPSHV
uniref:Coiled-coil domain-containing protein 167 n=2 Tax=Arion vulgaris TaxID=1028688 RepID=A0A0B6ZW49_9EUPU